MELHLQSPAKINLLLRVCGRRADGYHELETWMQKLDLYDELTLRLGHKTGIRLECDAPDIPDDKTNLAFKAAESFFKVSKRAEGFGLDIKLKKRIPHGAGLGGGSSDCGTVLRGLNTLFENEFSEKQLIALACPLGADVPFFAVEHGAVLATGIGEIMQPVPSLDLCTFILINPGFSVSTRWVFETFALTRDGGNSILPASRNCDVNSLSLAEMYNDLEPVTSKAHPEVKKMEKDLLDVGAKTAMMSGSGPTVFGVFPDNKFDKNDLSRVAEKLRREYKERVFVARSCAGAWPSGEGTGF